MPPINVDDEGADPTGGANSVAAFQSALAQAAGNGVTANGTYKLAGLILIGIPGDHETLRDADPTGSIDSTQAFFDHITTAAGRGVLMPPGAGTYLLSGLIADDKGLST